MYRIKPIFTLLFLLFSLHSCLQDAGVNDHGLLTGADQTNIYLPLVDGKTIAIVANQSSMVGEVHLVDTLLTLGVDIQKVFGPEHGFRGDADAGEHVMDGLDIKTQLPIISLYGDHRKPTAEDLQGIDIILFDLQDVGARFFTYIYTLTYVMETAAAFHIPVVILDRPNPNGFYIDGPVLENEYRSFVGMHPVPIVYGMTIGEYGKMLNGENWLANGVQCDLFVVPLKNYNRNQLYKLAVKPSPNLPSWQSIYLYPSLCLFEGTVVSVGRGTDSPFTVYGHPDFHIGSFAFTPGSRPGAKHPKLEGVQCYGQNLSGYAENYENIDDHFNLTWLINAYEIIGKDSNFFIPYFENLAGTGKLRDQIISGQSIIEIKASWQEGLEKFKKIRKKYLIYEDFE